jgi:hypothetical protein
MPAPTPDDLSAEYPHVPLMLSDRLPFEALRQAINESVSEPKLSAIDHQIERICKAYVAADERQRAMYRQQVKNGFSLLHYSKRMAVRALRYAEAELIELVGAAISLEDMRNDPRQSVRELAILHHVVRKRASDWNSVLDRIEAISSPKMQELIAGIRTRDPSSLELELFVHRETVDANGPTIELQPVVPRRRITPRVHPGCGQINIHS